MRREGFEVIAVLPSRCELGAATGLDQISALATTINASVRARQSPAASERSDCSRSYRGRIARQIAPPCSGSQDPDDAIEDTTVVHSGNAARLVRQHRLDGRRLTVGEFVAHDFEPWLGGLNHGLGARLNVPPTGLFGRYAPESGLFMLVLSSSHFDPGCVKTP